MGSKSSKNDNAEVQQPKPKDEPKVTFQTADMDTGFHMLETRRYIYVSDMTFVNQAFEKGLSIVYIGTTRKGKNVIVRVKIGDKDVKIVLNMKATSSDVAQMLGAIEFALDQPTEWNLIKSDPLRA